MKKNTPQSSIGRWLQNEAHPKDEPKPISKPTTEKTPKKTPKKK
jgi:hypothetical protein